MFLDLRAQAAAIVRHYFRPADEVVTEGFTVDVRRSPRTLALHQARL